ncbi:hypothetical protein RJ639_035658, partial [Escallonia herrerae]
MGGLIYSTDENASGEESDKIDWDTEDEEEIQNIPVSSCSSLTISSRDAITGTKIQDAPVSSCSSLTLCGGETIAGNGEASSSRGSSYSKLIHHFVGMGFPENLVVKAVDENEESNTESILETILAYTELESSPKKKQCAISSQWSSDYDESFLDDLSDTDSWFDDEENTSSLSDKEKTLLTLANMGYTVEEASLAMDRCGSEASLDELTDCICAAQMAKAADAYLPEDKPAKRLYNEYDKLKKRKSSVYESLSRKNQRGYEKKILNENEMIRIPKPMIGFGVPCLTESCQVTDRNLPEGATGPPYFYYENVALTPKGVWDSISRFLYDIEPEFVDSKYFCAAARKRGYIHNLPIHNRFPLLPLPPLTIHAAFPLTRNWWPTWDTRTKLNCLQTVIGSAKMTHRIRKALENWDREPPLHVQKYVRDECRKWNLVWVGRNKLAPLECDEVEMLLGFPRNHTRGGGISRTDRYKSLGNSFQVDTVAYHLSVLKDLYPGGINLLSLFSGIGGAEVALHRLGITLKNVLSVEISEVNRNIFRSWWEQTNQKGNLIEVPDVQQVDDNFLGQVMDSFGGFDLVVGGSPCNNLAGSNRVSRDGLDGKQSALFYDYYRILDSMCDIAKRSTLSSNIMGVKLLYS